MKNLLPKPTRHKGYKPLKPRTLRGKLKTMRQLIGFAVQRKWLREDPTAGYVLPPAVKEETFCWPPGGEKGGGEKGTFYFSVFLGRPRGRIDDSNPNCTEGMKNLLPKPTRHKGYKPLKPRTLRGKLKTMRQLIGFAVQRKWLREDPTAGYVLPPAVKEETFCWPPEELQAIREHAESEYLPIFDFLRLTGLRSGEFCWLTKEDVDFDHPHVKIRAKACPQIGKRWRPKHGAERIVPLTSEALAIARKAFDESQGPWLFWAPNTYGKQPGHYTVIRLCGAVKRAMKLAGVQKGSTHTFRHLFCSAVANSGVPPFQLMRLLGHRDLRTVMVYYHLDDQQLLGALDKVSFNQPLQAVADTTAPASVPGAGEKMEASE